jgi:APA family basic amino acid/polyamine antiporter
MAVGTATFQLPVLFGPGFAAPVELGPLAIAGPTFWGMVIVLALTAVNHLGIVLSGRVQLVPAPGPYDVAQAYLPVYFAYSGWNAAIYIGGEIDDPGRNLPRAVVGGTAMVAVLYFVLCAGYLAVFDMSALAGAGEAGTAAAGALFGHAGVIAVTLMILLAMLGSINGTVMAGSRIGYAMAEQGDFFAAAGRLSPRFGTPVVALWLQAALACALILSRRFDQLMEYAAAAMLISGSLAVASVIALRRKDPEHPRPYRIGFYPWAPLIYVGSSVFVLSALAAKGDLSVLMAASWFSLALLFHARLR